MTTVDRRHRPGYHFLPPSGWMNDPNGVIQWHGVYHLFYQHNPDEAVHRNVHWGHATSTDLMHWEHRPIALTPQAGAADAAGCWSGSAVEHDGRPVILYTGVTGGRPYVETQCLATGDLDLDTLAKRPEGPVIAERPQGLDLLAFRDPCPWCEPDGWHLALGTGIAGAGPTLLHYRSEDLVTWTYLGTLTDPSFRAPHGPSLGAIWECPQFFKLGDEQVLLVSVLGDHPEHVVCMMGPYTNGTFAPRSVTLVDAGPDLYAPITMLDTAGRRLMFGWSWEARTRAVQKEAGWAGVLTVPRVLTAGPDGRLRYEPVPELHRLRREVAHIQPVVVTTEHQFQLPMHADMADIQLSLKAIGEARWALSVLRSADGVEHSDIRYDGSTGVLTLDRSHASLDPAVNGGRYSVNVTPGSDGVINLRVLIDRSIIEVFANDAPPLTARVYPVGTASQHMSLAFAAGEVDIRSGSVWRLASTNVE